MGMRNGSQILRHLTRFAVLIAASAVLPAQQTVWFTPLPYAKHPDGSFGSQDYLNLFSPTAPWQKAAAHVRVFKVYGEGVGALSDADLRKVLADLKRRQIALAMEWPVLTSQTCGIGIEGFGGGLLPILKRIKAAGGTLAYLAMEQPFQWGSLWKGASSCQWTARQVALNALVEVKQAKALFPKLLVGDIMAVPAFREVGPDWDKQFGIWFDTWRSVSGAPLAFFHVDVDWTVPNWQAAVSAVRAQVERRGIRFGVVYNGFLTEESDTAWMAAAENHFIDYEVRAGNAAPSQVDFQSWNPHPTHVLPETDPTAFTHLIDRYFRTRTKLTLTKTGAQIHGTLRAGATAVPGAHIQITGQPVSGKGSVTTYTISGTVPANAHSALVGARVNSECYSCNGANDLTVFAFQYSETNSRKPNTWDFAKGISGWTYGPGTPVFETEHPQGQGLNVKAQAGQALGFNSAPVTVTPKAQFTLRITARVAPLSVGSGYFTLIWFDAAGREPSREILLFRPRTVELGDATTAADGSFQIGALPDANAYDVTAEYAGSDTLWPAMAKLPAGASAPPPHAPAR
jgi:hypothetical protein